MHLGTFFAALIYFYKDIVKIIKGLFKFKAADFETKQILKFLVISSLISGFWGFVLIKTFAGFEKKLELSAGIITLVVGLLLITTGILQIKAKKKEEKKMVDAGNKDGVLLGLVQSFASLPGLSRSGLTVSVLLLRKFRSEAALKLSFLMSLPIVLGGNIILNLDKFNFSLESFSGLLFSFVFGLLTIKLLLKTARKINFGWFVLFFGIIVIISIFI